MTSTKSTTSSMKTLAISVLTLSTISVTAAPTDPQKEILISTETSQPSTTKTLAVGTLTILPTALPKVKRQDPFSGQSPFQPHEDPWADRPPLKGPPDEQQPSQPDQQPAPPDQQPSPPEQSAPPPPPPSQPPAPPPAPPPSPPSSSTEQPPSASPPSQTPIQPPPSQPPGPSSSPPPESIPGPKDPADRLVITSYISNSCSFPIYLTSATCCPSSTHASPDSRLTCSTPTTKLSPSSSLFNITHATTDSCGQSIKISRTGDWTGQVYQIEYAVDGELVWYNLSAIDGDPFWEVKRRLKVKGMDEKCETMECEAGEARGACNWPTLGDCAAKEGNDVSFELC